MPAAGFIWDVSQKLEEITSLPALSLWSFGWDSIDVPTPGNSRRDPASSIPKSDFIGRASRGVRQRQNQYILKEPLDTTVQVPTNALFTHCDPYYRFSHCCLFTSERPTGFHQLFQVDVRRVTRISFTDHPLRGYRDSHPGFHAGPHEEIPGNRGTQ